MADAAADATPKFEPGHCYAEGSAGYVIIADKDGALWRVSLVNADMTKVRVKEPS